MSKQIDFIQLFNSINKINLDQPHMADIQKFNQFMIAELDKICLIKDKKILDLGASKYGHALVESLNRGVEEYVGIDLDINQEIETEHLKSTGKLLKMNAEKLNYKDDYFDDIITISTFEHFLNPIKVLNEMYRVLKIGGQALITFGPIWSSAKGYHLHQYPNIAKYIPKWSHLILNKEEMKKLLKDKNYPDNLDLSLNQVLNWIYTDKDINRLDVQRLKEAFLDSKFKSEWIVPLFDEETTENKAISKYLSTILPFTSKELMTRGFSILLSKN